MGKKQTKEEEFDFSDIVDAQPKEASHDEFDFSDIVKKKDESQSTSKSPTQTSPVSGNGLPKRPGDAGYIDPFANTIPDRFTKAPSDAYSNPAIEPPTTQKKEAEKKLYEEKFAQPKQEAKILKKEKSLLETSNPELASQIDAGLKKQKEEKIAEEGAHEAALNAMTPLEKTQNTVAAFTKPFYKLPADALTAIAAGANFIDDNLGTDDSKKEIKDYATYHAADWINKQVDELMPENSNFKKTYTSQLAGGLGQIVPMLFASGAPAARALSQAPKIAPGLIGASKRAVAEMASTQSAIAGTQVFSSEFRQAKEGGADDATATYVAAANALATTPLERLPIANAFKRIDKAFDGSFVKRLVANAATGSVEEAVTEDLQTGFSNFTAQKTYDTTREITDGLIETAAVSGGVGAIFNALLTALGGRKARAKTPEEATKIEEAENYVKERAAQSASPEVGAQAAESSTSNKTTENNETVDNNATGERISVSGSESAGQGEHESVRPSGDNSKITGENNVNPKENIKLEDDGPGTISQGGHREGVESNSRDEEVANELRGRIGAAQEAADISQGDGKGGQDTREIDNKVAYDFAKETNTWIDDIHSLGKPFIGGNENTNVVNEDQQKVYKSNNLANSVSLSNFFDKVRLHNLVFPKTAYKFEGLTGIEEGAKRKPYVEPVYSQDLVKGAEPATVSEISEYMKNRGFEDLGNFKFKKGDIEVSDLRPRNVLKDKDGDIYVVDAEFKQTKEGGEQNAPQGQPPTPPNTGDGFGQSPEAEDKQLKVAKRIFESPNVSDEVKIGLKEKGSTYTPVNNSLTDSDARAIVDFHGPEEARSMINNSGNGMQPLARGAVARQLFEHYSDEASKAESPASKLASTEKAVEVGALAAKLFKDAGQTVQSAKMWKRMLKKTPEGMLMSIQKDYHDQRDQALSAIQKELHVDKDNLDKIIAGNIEEVLSHPDIKKRIDQIVAEKEDTPKNRRKKIENFFDSLIIKTDKDQLYDATYLVAAKVYNGAIGVMKKAYLQGFDIKVAIEKAIKHINDNNDGKAWDKDGFEAEFTEKLSALPKIDDVKITPQLVNENLSESINSIAKKHYTEVEKIKTNLTEKLVSQLNIDADVAKKVAGEIESKFSEMLSKKRSQMLGKLSQAKKINDPSQKKFLDDLNKEINLGAFDNEKFQDLYAKAIGVPTLDADQKQKILDLSAKVKAAEDFIDQYKKDFTPENKKKYQKLQEESEKAFGELSNMFGKKRDVWDTMAIMMQGNLLTPLSIITNIYSNAVLQPLRFATKGVASAADYLLSKASRTKRSMDFLATQKGFFQGIAPGIVRGSKQLLTGPPSEDMAKGELSQAFAPIANWMKVASLIKNKEYTRELADNFSYSLFGTPAEAMFRALNFGDKPFSSAAFHAKAREIGELAGLKGEELEKFMEFPDEANLEKITQHAKRGTFQQNEGVNKSIQEGINRLLTKISEFPVVGGPAKLILKSQIPFVRTPLNIISETIDYAVPPLSLAKGLYQLSKGNRAEGLTFISKAIVGTMIGQAAGLLFKHGLISPSAEDEEKERAMQLQEFPPEGVNMSGLQRLLTGASPKAMKGDIWMNYKKIGPMGIILNNHANRLNKIDPKTDQSNLDSFIQQTFGALPGIATASLEQSFLQNTNSLLTAIKEGGDKLDRWMVNTAVTLTSVGIPNTVSALSRASTEFSPETKAPTLSDQFVNVMKSRYFMGDELPSKVNLWGEKVTQTPVGRNKYLYQFVDPTKFRELKTNDWSYKIYELWNKTKDNHTLPSLPPKKQKINGEEIKLDPYDYEKLKIMVGKNRAALTEAVVNSDQWEHLSDERKAERLDHAYDRGLKSGRREFKKFYNARNKKK